MLSWATCASGSARICAYLFDDGAEARKIQLRAGRRLERGDAHTQRRDVAPIRSAATWHLGRGSTRGRWRAFHHRYKLTLL